MASQPVEIADLPTIDMYKLLIHDTTEHQRLFEAAQSPGIFHLDFTNFRTPVLGAPDEMYALSDRYFMQSSEEKEKDVRMDQLPSQDRGFKKSENDETFEMADDELLAGSTQLPAVIADKRALVNEFCESCRIATTSMLASLSQSLARVKPDLKVHLESYHHRTIPSDTGLKLIYEPTVARAADVVENKHTDSGTFTVLFYTEWGLHVFLPSESESESGAAAATQGEQQSGQWAYAAPKPNCALVNVADSLQRLSGGLFHSPLHRVTQHEDGERKRYYLSYFLRPAHTLKEEWARNDAAAAAAAVTGSQVEVVA